jgi:predicted nucleotidyltransferase
VGLLAGLRRALRTERTVRLAILYGSLARGDEDADSDLDLLVAVTADGIGAVRALPARLRDVTTRRVDMAYLDRVEHDAPLLLDRVIDEGRVLVDRDGEWGRLRDRRRAVGARAERAYRRQMDDASRAIAELIGG